MTQNKINVYRRYLPDGPSEWADPSQQTLEKLRLGESGVLTPEQYLTERMEITGARWFLLRNTYNWECGNCGAGKYGTKGHEFITYACLPRPYAGMDDALLNLDRMGVNRLVAEQMLFGDKMVPLKPHEARRYIRDIHRKTGVNLERVFQERQRQQYREHVALLKNEETIARERMVR